MPSRILSVRSLCRQLLDLVDHEAAATHHPTPANEEHEDEGLEIVVCDADHIDVLVAVGNHLLFGDRLVDRGDPVSDSRCLFELEGLGRRVHLGPELRRARSRCHRREIGTDRRPSRRTRPCRPHRHTGQSTSRCGREGRACRSSDADRTCCWCRCEPGTSAAADRACRGWHTHGRTGRNSGCPSASCLASPGDVAIRRRA